MSDIVYQELAPPPSLAPVVRCIWMLRAGVSDVPDAQPIVPDGCVELVYHLADPFRRRTRQGSWVVQPRALLVGAVAEPTVVEPLGATDVVGIRLHPWSGRQFLGFPLSELDGARPDLDHADRSLGSDIAAMLGDTPDGATRLARLTRALEARVGRRAPPDPATRAAIERVMRSAEVPSVRQVASSIGRSTRWVQRAFADSVGFSPKMLARIARVQRALRLARRDERASWSTIAADAGYFDHSHLIRDFKQLVGCTPSRFDPRAMPLTDAFVEA